MATLTASAKAVTYSNPGMHIAENFAAVLAAGLDEVRKREMADPMEGSRYYRTKPMNKNTLQFQSHYGLGYVAQNRDADDMPYDEKGLGFGWSLSSNTFRGAIAIEKELQEDELYGTISDLQSGLVGGEKLTREMIMADGFNRCLGTSGAPFLCEDGMYLIDSDRPNPYKPAGTWSNLEASSAITPTSIYTAQLAFAAYKDERGLLKPMVMKKMIVRPTDEKTVWEIIQSDLRPTDAMNAANYMKGRFSYEVYNRLTSAVILYMAGESGQDAKNELYFGERIAAEVKTWVGDNPDIIRQRIRSRFGIGCGRPHYFRGGVVS